MQALSHYLPTGGVRGLVAPCGRAVTGDRARIENPRVPGSIPGPSTSETRFSDGKAGVAIASRFRAERALDLTQHDRVGLEPQGTARELAILHRERGLFALPDRN